MVTQAAEVDGERFRLPRVAPRTLFLSGRIEGTLASDGAASLVVWQYRHHLVEYVAVAFLAVLVAPGIVLGIVGLWVAQSYALVILAYTLLNGLMLAVVLQLIHDERAKLRGDLEKTLGRAGHWAVLAHEAGT